MAHAPILRLLELVRRRLGASDARVEIGGRPPDDPAVVAVELPSEMRLVAIFEVAPQDRGDARARLQELADSFHETLVDPRDGASAGRTPATLSGRRLDDALEALRAQIEADRVFVMDVQSPVLWGAAPRDEHPRTARAVSEVQRAQRDEPADRLVIRDADFAMLSRGFARIYRLVAVFDADFSELHVEGALLRALPAVEQLLFALPPVDPPPKTAKVVQLPKRGSR